MTKNQIISTIRNQLKNEFYNEPTGHDWWHIDRVYKLSLIVSKQINKPIDLFVIKLGALLHDIADWKFNGGNSEKGPQKAKKILESMSIDQNIIKKVTEIVKEISYKGAGVETPMTSLEGKIVQDADRLDALGAIGIARTFAYGGKAGRPIYDPRIKPLLHQTFEEYKKNQSHSLNHFYEKLFLLYERLNTKEAKSIGRYRMLYMKKFVKQFLDEWNV